MYMLDLIVAARTAVEVRQFMAKSVDVHLYLAIIERRNSEFLVLGE